jgi:hypothetical protein
VTDATGEAAAAAGEAGRGETGETGATLMASTTLDPRTPNWPHMRKDEALITQIGSTWYERRVRSNEDELGIDGEVQEART